MVGADVATVEKDLPVLGRDLIERILYLTLSTVDEHGQPWCSPVNTAFDADYNFYWGSAINKQHSRNICANGKAFAVIYDSSLPEGVGNAVYMVGHARELTPQTWQEGLALLRSRSSNPDKYYPRSYYQTLRAQRIYMFSPQEFYMLKPGGEIIDGAFTSQRMAVDLRQVNQ